jgi:hypothetical protein
MPLRFIQPHICSGDHCSSVSSLTTSLLTQGNSFLGAEKRSFRMSADSCAWAAMYLPKRFLLRFISLQTTDLSLSISLAISAGHNPTLRYDIISYLCPSVMWFFIFLFFTTQKYYFLPNAPRTFCFLALLCLSFVLHFLFELKTKH